MNNTPKISVIIPLYNKETIIERSLQSVLSQDYDDFEVILVNDGSTDRSMEIVRNIQDPRIVLIEQENGGPSKARNTGVMHAKGEWVLFLDADDELLPNALHVFAKLADKHSEADIIDCGQKIKKGNTISSIYHPIEGFSDCPLRDWFFHRIGPGSNHSIFNRAFAKKYPYNPKIRRFEDAELLVRMLQTAKVFSTTVPTSLVNCDFSSASKKCENISYDYSGHLSMKGLSFWATMCVYRTYLENRELYPEDMHRLYPTWCYRYDLLLTYKLLTWFYT